jgi:hypothetical protein
VQTIKQFRGRRGVITLKRDFDQFYIEIIDPAVCSDNTISFGCNQVEAWRCYKSCIDWAQKLDALHDEITKSFDEL